MIFSPRAKEQFYSVQTTMLAVEDDLLDQLSEAVKFEGTQTALAWDLCVSESLLRKVLHGRRGISEKLAGKLGWRKVTVFVRP